MSEHRTEAPMPATTSRKPPPRIPQTPSPRIRFAQRQPARAPEYESVELHISKEGFASQQRSILTGSEPMQIKLRRQ